MKNLHYLFLIVFSLLLSNSSCQKKSDKLVINYSDKELNINSNSVFAKEERKIKNGIMNFSKLTISERRQIVNGIIMENKNISHIQNNVMDIISILNKEDIIELFKLLIPNSAFKIIDSKNKVIIEYTPSWTPCDYWTSYWYKKYSTYYADNCVAPGENICMRYVPCDR